MTTYENVTKPLYATVGAADALYDVVIDAVSQVKERAGVADVTGQVEKVREQLATLPADVQTQITTLRERISALPEVPEELTELRAKLTPEELRKTADTYVKSALDLYGELAGRGEETVERLRADERFEKAEGIYKEALGLAEEAIGKVTEQVTAVVGLVSGKPAEEAPVVDAEVVEPAPAPKKKAPKKAAVTEE